MLTFSYSIVQNGSITEWSNHKTSVAPSALLTALHPYSANDVLVVYCCSMVIQRISCKWQVGILSFQLKIRSLVLRLCFFLLFDLLLSPSLTSWFHDKYTYFPEPNTCNKEQPFLCFCCLSAICKKWKLSTTFINFVPSSFSGFYKEEYQIHYRVSKVPDETQAPSSQYTECIPRLIVPPSSESDILINCNNFTQLFNDLQLSKNTTYLYPIFIKNILLLLSIIPQCRNFELCVMYIYCHHCIAVNLFYW